MSDYLWDKAGDPDPEVERLEALLAPLGHDGRSLAVPRRGMPVRMLAIAASVLLCAGAAWLYVARQRGAWAVELSGGSTLRLHEGQSLETGRSTARIEVGGIGAVDVESDSKLRLVRSRSTEQRMALDRGRIHAMIWAPPRRFFVDTPAAVAVDLGCAYTLSVDARGDSLVEVQTGWVAFEAHGLESFIPAGAACVTRASAGPGTPYFEDAPPAFRDALSRLDHGFDAAALQTVLGQARSRDAFTLWHLLPRVDGTAREQVYDRLAALAKPPEGVSREGALRADRAVLDRWWNSLGLAEASWFRLWRQQ